MNLLRHSLPKITLTIAFMAVTGPVFAESQEEYFEKNVRPVLAAHCFECHGAKRQESNVRLDLRSFVHSEKQPLVLAGNVDGSRLWHVIQHNDDDSQMPPDQKMSDEELAIVKHWIETGAFWPEGGEQHIEVGQPRNDDGTYNFVEAVKQHWAYQPVLDRPVPQTSLDSQAKNEIDHFIYQSLEKSNLTPSPQASRETLIRRVAMDLVGLPPTPEEVQAFVSDTDPQAYEKLVDHYLADPGYGERWARMWLDISRYADTKGYVFVENRFYPYSYTYRDYVVRAFNSDTPYNQFITEQLAADRLGLAENDERLAALGFLTLGNRFLNSPHDIIDDRIDVVTRGLLAMTVACARCHDHKYDPIPAADYYSLYGVFQSTHEPAMGPIIGTIDETKPEYIAFKEELTKREEAKVNTAIAIHTRLLKELTDKTNDCVLAVGNKLELYPVDNIPWLEKEPRIKLIDRWKTYITAQTSRDDTSPVWVPWKSLMALTDEQLSTSAADTIDALLANETIPQPLKEALQANPPKTRLDVAQLYAKLLTDINNEWTQARAQDPPAETLADAGRDMIRQQIHGAGSLTDLERRGFESDLFELDNRQEIQNHQTAINDWYAQSPGAPPRATLILDNETPAKPVIFLRGDPARRGEEITRHTPRILTPEEEIPYSNGSGRLELAQAITNPNNPLTARVIVNRVWARHFGAPLVESMSDFGARSAEPTHPELLDYLANAFMHQDEWSLKALHRRMLLSSTYQQASIDRPAATEVDPLNLLLWRQNRQRMEFETMRDSMLAVAGELDRQIGGRPIPIENAEFNSRRTIYGLIDRNNLPGLFRTFDFPSPDTSSQGRPVTTVPQQALFLMNSPFMQQTSEKLAQKVRNESSDPKTQAKRLLELAFSRAASDEEVEIVARYIESSPLEQVAQAMLMTNNFAFVD